VWEELNEISDGFKGGTECVDGEKRSASGEALPDRDLDRHGLKPPKQKYSPTKRNEAY